jgi:hypothetical protein
MKWDWGNSDSDKIYHDPETRRESITYRTNRPIGSNWLKVWKGKNDYWFGADKKPLDKFGYYSLVEPLQKDTTKWVKKKAQVLEKLMAIKTILITIAI